MQIVPGAAANEVGVLRAVLGEPLRGLLEMTKSFTRARDIGRQTGIFRVLLEETLDLREIGAGHPATLKPELATDQVESLYAVHPFVDLRDACVAHELFHAVLCDISVAAVDL